MQEALCTFRRLSARAGGLLHGKAFSLGRAEGSLHGEACSLRRTENPLHVCTSLGVPISIHILDPWPSNRPFRQLGQLDTEMTQNGSQIVHFGYLGYLGSLAQKYSKWVPNRPFSPTSNKPQEATSNKPQESGVVTRLLPNWLFAPCFENAPPQKPSRRITPIRNSLGITPTGPMGPKGAEGALAQGGRRAPWPPWVPGTRALFLGPGSQALGPRV